LQITINPYDKKSIEKAIKQLTEYKNKLAEKEAEMVRRIAQLGLNVASVKFKQALYAGTNDVTCRVEQNGTTATIYAEGEAVGFIEFGTGVRHPEHPGFADYQQPAHGTYGKGLGKNPGWWDYNGDPGNKGHLITTKSGRTKVRTSGNDPAFAMFDAINSMVEQIATIAREVWSSD
jgi:hypothetical protein